MFFSQHFSFPCQYHSTIAQKNSINNISTVETSNIATKHRLPAQKQDILHPTEGK